MIGWGGKSRFESVIQEQPLAEGRWEEPRRTLPAPWQKGGGLTDISFIAPSFSSANPLQLLVSPLLQGCSTGAGLMADGPALGWPCRVNPPCPPPLDICTTCWKHEQHLC